VKIRMAEVKSAAKLSAENRKNERNALYQANHVIIKAVKSAKDKNGNIRVIKIEDGKGFGKLMKEHITILEHLDNMQRLSKNRLNRFQVPTNYGDRSGVVTIMRSDIRKWRKVVYRKLRDLSKMYSGVIRSRPKFYDATTNQWLGASRTNKGFNGPVALSQRLLDFIGAADFGKAANGNDLKSQLNLQRGVSTASRINQLFLIYATYRAGEMKPYDDKSLIRADQTMINYFSGDFAALAAAGPSYSVKSGKPSLAFDAQKFKQSRIPSLTARLVAGKSAPDFKGNEAAFKAYLDQRINGDAARDQAVAADRALMAATSAVYKLQNAPAAKARSNAQRKNKQAEKKRDKMAKATARPLQLSQLAIGNAQVGPIPSR